MFGFSFAEIFIISIVALLVLGPERIPQVARSFGRILADLRRATNEVKKEFNYSEFTRTNSILNLPTQNNLRTEGLEILNTPVKEEIASEVVEQATVEKKRE